MSQQYKAEGSSQGMTAMLLHHSLHSARDRLDRILRERTQYLQRVPHPRINNRIIHKCRNGVLFSALCYARVNYIVQCRSAYSTPSGHIKLEEVAEIHELAPRTAGSPSGDKEAKRIALSWQSAARPDWSEWVMQEESVPRECWSLDMSDVSSVSSDSWYGWEDPNKEYWYYSASDHGRYHYDDTYNSDHDEQ